MWIACVPGGNCETFTSTRTPPADGTNVAVPILSPDALTMSACAPVAICTEDLSATFCVCTWAFAAAQNKPAQIAKETVAAVRMLMEAPQAPTGTAIYRCVTAKNAIG